MWALEEGLPSLLHSLLHFFLCKATLCLLSGPAALFVGGLRPHQPSLNNAVTVSMSMSISLLQQTSAFISFLVHVSGRGGKPKVDASQMLPRCLPDASQMPLRCLSDAFQMPPTTRCLSDAPQMPPTPRCLSDASQMPLRCFSDASQMPPSFPDASHIPSPQ